MDKTSYSSSFESSACGGGWKASRGTHLLFCAPLTQAPAPSIHSTTPSIVSPLINVTLTLSPGLGRDMTGRTGILLGYHKTLTWTFTQSRGHQLMRHEMPKGSIFSCGFVSVWA